MIVIDVPPGLTGPPVSRAKGTSAPSQKYYENEIVKGRVLKSVSSEEAILLIKGTKVSARAFAPLKEGTELWLQLEKTSPRLTFRVLSTGPAGPFEVNSSELVAAIRSNIWKALYDHLSTHGSAGAAGERFVKLMNELSQTVFLKPSADMLDKLFELCGMHWEKKLRHLLEQNRFSRENIASMADQDLKGSAALLADTRDEWAEKFVSVIKQLQLLNHAAVNQDRKAFIPVPMLFPDGSFSLGQLLIHLPDKESKDGRCNRAENAPVRITFLLEMSRLGPLRVDLVVVDKQISGRFILSDAPAQKIFSKHLASLAEALSDRGFVVKQMSCLVKELAVFKETLIEEVFPSETSRIRWIA